VQNTTVTNIMGSIHPQEFLKIEMENSSSYSCVQLSVNLVKAFVMDPCTSRIDPDFCRGFQFTLNYLPIIESSRVVTGE